MDTDNGSLTRTTQSRRIAVSVLIALTALLVAGWTVHRFVTSADPMPFDRDAWRSHARPFISQPLRFRMARHLEMNGELIGKTEEEIHAMLDSAADPGTRIGDNMLVYGVKNVGVSDHVFLQLVLDSERRVVRVVGPDG